ncbi:MAG: hypothetical protein WCS43_06395 [Verrucomicrobiota bacterium]
MTNHRLLTGILASLTLYGSGILPVSAQLPTVVTKPWQGYYTGFANRHFQFTVTSDGLITLAPIGDKGEPVAKKLAVPIDIAIQETAPDGKVTTKKIKLESLKSTDPVADNLVKTTFTGKITGDASFEVTIEQQRNVISIGGCILDPGTLKKDQLRFAILVKFPNPYYSAITTGKKEEKAFEKIVSKDRIDIKWADGKRKKFALDEKVDAITKEGAGIVSAEIDISAYKGQKIMFVSSPNSSMTFSTDQVTPLYGGFTIVWTPDANKDPDGKARLSFEVK